MIFFQKYKVQNATVLHLEKINKKKILTVHSRSFKYITDQNSILTQHSTYESVLTTPSPPHTGYVCGTN